MSPLTKVFVMLLVVCSLLNAAATVVYVNKEQTTAKDYKAMQDSNASLARDRDAALAAAGTAASQLTAQEQVAASEAAGRQGLLDKANADLAHKDADYAMILRDKQAQDGNIQQLNAQLAIALATNKQDSQALGDLRDANGKLVQGQAESDAALARQRQLAETYGREVEYLREQTKKFQDTIKAYSDLILQNHLTLPTQQAVTYNGPAVSGTVVEKQLINGVPYLTISVGATDSVQPGMEFRVVDIQAQPHQFLGLLTITHADANSSVGRLQTEDNLVARIKKGDEVTTDVQ